MNTFSTNNLPRDIALTQTKVTEEKKGPFWAVYKDAVEFGVNYAQKTLFACRLE
jgi:hypothetical protein